MRYWMLENNERVVGPFTAGEVVKRANPNTLISLGADWVPYCRHRDFRTAENPPSTHSSDSLMWKVGASSGQRTVSIRTWWFIAVPGSLLCLAMATASTGQIPLGPSIMAAGLLVLPGVVGSLLPNVSPVVTFAIGTFGSLGISVLASVNGVPPLADFALASTTFSFIYLLVGSITGGPIYLIVRAIRGSQAKERSAPDRVGSAASGRHSLSGQGHVNDRPSPSVHPSGGSSADTDDCNQVSPPAGTPHATAVGGGGAIRGQSPDCDNGFDGGEGVWESPSHESRFQNDLYKALNVDGSETLPSPEEEVQRWYERGLIDHRCLIWKNADRRWLPLSDRFELSLWRCPSSSDFNGARLRTRRLPSRSLLDVGTSGESVQSSTVIRGFANSDHAFKVTSTKGRESTWVRSEKIRSLFESGKIGNDSMVFVGGKVGCWYPLTEVFDSSEWEQPSEPAIEKADGPPPSVVNTAPESNPLPQQGPVDSTQHGPSMKGSSSPFAILSTSDLFRMIESSVLNDDGLRQVLEVLESRGVRVTDPVVIRGNHT